MRSEPELDQEGHRSLERCVDCCCNDAPGQNALVKHGFAFMIFSLLFSLFRYVEIAFAFRTFNFRR